MTKTFQFCDCFPPRYQGVLVIKLYHAPRTRSVRIYWLLEELGLAYELETIVFKTPVTAFSQATPNGKVPVIQDGALTMFESGAIVEYILEQYGEGRLAPAPRSAQRGAFLQWLHFSEATAFPPLGEIVRHTRHKPETERIPAVVADARSRASAALEIADRQLAGSDYLLGTEFSAADIMMGFTVQVAKWLGVLAEPERNLTAYLDRLGARPAFQKALRS